MGGGGLDVFVFIFYFCNIAKYSTIINGALHKRNLKYLFLPHLSTSSSPAVLNQVDRYSPCVYTTLNNCSSGVFFLSWKNVNKCRVV